MASVLLFIILGAKLLDNSVDPYVCMCSEISSKNYATFSKSRFKNKFMQPLLLKIVQISLIY